MLRVLEMKRMTPIKGERGEELFKENPTFQFRIEAPMYWWIDIDWPKYYFNMPLYDMKVCTDTWTNTGIVPELNNMLRILAHENSGKERKIMQLLPLSTLVNAVLELNYQQVVEVCENYVAGEYVYHRHYSFPNEREWNDFCETLLDIKGVRDLIVEP